MPGLETIPRRRTRPQGLATRARLLEAAEQLFSRRGYAGTSMSDVATRAGIGVGTVYHHFSDKRALLLELIERWAGRQTLGHRSDLVHEAFLESDPRAGIETWLRAAYARLREQPSLYLVVLECAPQDAEIGRRYAQIEQFEIERLSSLIEFGKRRGVMQSGLDARAAAFLIHHAIDAAATQVLVHGIEDPSPERILSGLAEMICGFVLKEEP